MSKYTTGELAKLCGVTVRTVQYYDTRGILIPSELSEGGRRLYSEDDLKRMKIICFLRDAGISINSIGELLSEDDPGSVISVLLEQQEQVLREEVSERQDKLAILDGIKKELLAFMKKEWMEQVRSGRLLILVIIFILLGIMNPTVAKLTPWLLEMMADSLEASGMTVTAVTVSTMDSWAQFFKNAPMGLIAFILLESSIFTKEYQSGTLVLALTKGLDRHKVVISKAIILTLLWTVCYWFCFTITFGYNTYFWDISIAQNLFFSVICWWLFGLLVVALTVLFSTLSNSNTGVLAGTGCTVLVSYLIGLIPKAKEYLPTLLMDGNSLIFGTVEARSYVTAIYITVLLSVVCLAISFPVPVNGRSLKELSLENETTLESVVLLKR